MWWLDTGLGLVIGFIEILQLLTTKNYNVLTNSSILQITTAHAKSSQSAVSSPVVAWQWSQCPLLLMSLLAVSQLTHGHNCSWWRLALWSVGWIAAGLSSRVSLGLGSCRDAWSYFCSFQELYMFWKHHFKQFLHCWLYICCHRNQLSCVVHRTLPRNRRFLPALRCHVTVL
jgi:hypothetical protein